jgi:hypothetical protein
MSGRFGVNKGGTTGYYSLPFDLRGRLFLFLFLKEM